MHILYLHQYFGTPNGQTGTRSYEFARRWVAAGNRVTMLTSTAQLTEGDLGGTPRRLVTRVNVDGIAVIALRVRYRQSMGFLRRLWAFASFMVLASWFTVRLPDVDVIYATSTPLTVGVPALIARWARRRRYVFEVRDAWPAVPIALGVIRQPLLIRLLRWLERTIYAGASAIVTLSPGMTELVRAAAPAGKRIETIPNGADTDLFTPQISAEPVRRERGWEGRFVCLHAGAMGRVNGLDCILRAAERFRSDCDFLFVLLGEGNEKARLIEARDRLGLKNLEILPGLPKHQMPAVLAAADVGLMTVAAFPILEHNSANKLFDYLSAGKLVVLNYGGWQREVLESCGAGAGTPLGDEEAFFANLAVLQTDPTRRRTMGDNARRLALEVFQRDALAAQALDVIERID